MTIEHNLIVYREGTLLGSNWHDSKFALDHNLYWNDGKPVLFEKKSLEEWQKLGHDQNSLIADPLFVDAAQFNFALKPDSPAAKIGFVPFDVSTDGTLRKRQRVEDWPRAFPPRPATAKPQP